MYLIPERNTKYENTPKRRAEARKKDQFKGGIRVFQHVDDLTQIMWAKGEGDLADKSYNSVRVWAQEVRLACACSAVTRTSSFRRGCLQALYKEHC